MPLKIKTEQPTDVFLKCEMFKDKGYREQFSIGKGQVARVASCVTGSNMKLPFQSAVQITMF